MRALLTPSLVSKLAASNAYPCRNSTLPATSLLPVNPLPFSPPKSPQAWATQICKRATIIGNRQGRRWRKALGNSFFDRQTVLYTDGETDSVTCCAQSHVLMYHADACHTIRLDAHCRCMCDSWIGRHSSMYACMQLPPFQGCIQLLRFEVTPLVTAELAAKVSRQRPQSRHPLCSVAR